MPKPPHNGAEADLERLRELRLPNGFHFGVTTSGFQTEGGYNGPDLPLNNWFDRELSGRIERSGIATDSWRHFTDDLRAIESIGCDSYNMSLEWARVQPSSTTQPEEPPFDDAAIDRYADLITEARARGIEPLVTLHHFTHPRWLGLDFWRRPDAPSTFARYVASIVPALTRRLQERGTDPIRTWVTSAELNVVALETWVTGIFPGGAFFHLRTAAQALDQLLAAHVLAYDAIHDLYEREGWPRPQVTTNNFSFATYEIDQGLVDLLLARRRGIAQQDLWQYLLERRARWYGEIARIPGPVRSPSERLYRRLATHVLWRGMPATIGALYGSRRVDKLDAISFDFYDPWIAGRLRAPWRRTDGWHVRIPARPQWEDPSLPDTLGRFCRLLSEGAEGLPLWLLENGMCSRVYKGVWHKRRDHLTRPRYLLDHIEAIARAVQEGAPISHYLYWTLYDNYEWGSYQPRYGLYGVDRDRGLERLERDALGDDSAGVYRQIIEALRGSPDRAVH